MKPVTLTVLNWAHVDLPMIGEYLKSERGRTAYLILEVIMPGPGMKHVARLRCERQNPASLPKDAVVWGWQWSKR